MKRSSKNTTGMILKRSRIFYKAAEVIDSCKNQRQLDMAKNYLDIARKGAVSCYQGYSLESILQRKKNQLVGFYDS